MAKSEAAGVSNDGAKSEDADIAASAGSGKRKAPNAFPSPATTQGVFYAVTAFNFNLCVLAAWREIPSFPWVVAGSYGRRRIADKRPNGLAGIARERSWLRYEAHRSRIRWICRLRGLRRPSYEAMPSQHACRDVGLAESGFALP